MPAPAQEHERGRDLGDGKGPQPPIGARGDADGAAGQAGAVGRVRRRQPRHERQQDRRDEREAHAHPQQARVDGHFQRAHREPRGVLCQHRHHRPRDQHTQGRAHSAQQQAFNQQRPPQGAGGGAKRGANGQLAFTADRARQDQVRDVRARDDEHQRRGRQEDQEHRSGRRRDLVTQPPGLDLEVGVARVRLGVRLEDVSMHGPQLVARGLEVRARREPAEELRHPMHAPMHHRRVQVVRARHDVSDDLGLRGIRHRRLDNADDRRGTVAEPYDLANRVRVARQRVAPEPVGQHHCACRLWTVVGHVEEPAAYGRRPITSKYDPPTTPARTTRGSPSPINVKSSVEKSPKVVSVLMRARRSLISGTENAALSAPMPWRSPGCRSDGFVLVHQRTEQHAAQ